MNLADFVKSRRSQRGMSQRDVASQGGLGLGTVSEIEAGNNTDPKASTIKGLALALKVKPEIILACAIEGLKGKS